jgi:hypothetical protein
MHALALALVLVAAPQLQLTVEPEGAASPTHVPLKVTFTNTGTVGFDVSTFGAGADPKDAGYLGMFVLGFEVTRLGGQSLDKQPTRLAPDALKRRVPMITQRPQRPIRDFPSSLDVHLEPAATWVVQVDLTEWLPLRSDATELPPGVYEVVATYDAADLTQLPISLSHVYVPGKLRSAPLRLEVK